MKTRPGRPLSICYLVPGHRLVPSAGPSRNVLNLSAALAEHADVTVAFRDVVGDVDLGRVRTREIDPAPPGDPTTRITDDAALRGVGYRGFLGFMRGLRRFVDATAGEFDVVLEKGWIGSGYASVRYRRRGVPSIPVENLIQTVSSSGHDRLGTRIKRMAGRKLAGRSLRRAPRIIAETTALRDALGRCYHIDTDRIRVIPLGVDRQRFRPCDREAARAALGLASGTMLLLYVGILDRIHDLGPAIRGLCHAPAARLLVVGDGPLRSTYAELAKGLGVADRVLFRGRVPHDEVPRYLAAADLCVAPYDPDAFYDDEVAYSTLKIREYLAAGRPVLSVRSGSIPGLVEDGVTGFLVPHDEEAWARALSTLPDRESLHAMGRKAALVPINTWAEVASEYLDTCEDVLREASRS